MNQDMWRLDQYKESCLGTNYDEIQPKCVKCDDRRECVILKTRWENKIKEAFTKKVGIKVIKPVVSTRNRILVVRKTKEQLEKERREYIRREAKALGLF